MAQNDADMERRNRVAQWAFDTRPVLLRFHLWLEDVEVDWLKGRYGSDFSFVPTALERCLVMTAGVTALGTYLFGRYGEGAGKDKAGLNEVKKDADAISAYVMSEGLWHLSRYLPENHAIMVCLGEGLMPKAGETAEMGSNPLLGFGRIYARPAVARKLARMVNRLINRPGYGWAQFQEEIEAAGITVWGSAVDTLENTSRFAKGSPSGPMTVLHLFNQPLTVTKPYEGYFGALFVPRQVAEIAEEQSLLLSFMTPRAKLLEVIELTYPGIERRNVHVWTLRGKSRETRLGKLWQEWQELGVHLVEDDWQTPSGHAVFCESGTYAPTYCVQAWDDEEGRKHVFLCDGYGASAEALQAASLTSTLGVHASLMLCSSRFDLAHDSEGRVMRLDPDAAGFAERFAAASGAQLPAQLVEQYRQSIIEARDANLPMESKTFSASDFFARRSWRMLALTGYMLDDPYSGASGVRQVGDQSYQVEVRAATSWGMARVTLTLRLMEPTMDENRLVYYPLLDRFYHLGVRYQERPVKISDSGRIRNELQTLAPQAVEFLSADRLRLDFSKVDDHVLAAEKKAFILEVLRWYKENHPVWFSWLEIA